MQLMPSTAQGVAKKLGVSYSAERLNDPDYNAQLGAAYLGSLVERFNGSYVMAAAGYNAGPGRSSQWAADCGDPRARQRRTAPSRHRPRRSTPFSDPTLPE